MSYFDNDDWQPADWLSAIERLAVTPPLEDIPVSSKMLDTATKEPAALKPCPFCGGAATLRETRDDPHWMVACTNCWAGSCLWSSPEPPIDEWNKRISELWPMPRTFANQIPDDQQMILVWHDQSWQPAYMSHNLKQYYLLAQPYENWHGLSVDGVWLPMPPALEVQA